MTSVYVDIRLKMHLRNDHNSCDNDLEAALNMGNSIVYRIGEEEKNIDNVEVVRIGKLSPLVFEIPEESLIEE